MKIKQKVARTKSGKGTKSGRRLKSLSMKQSIYINGYKDLSKWEIISSEGGKRYKVEKAFTVDTRYGEVTIPKGFEHDRYTVVPDLHDDLAAIVHDYLYTERKFDDGTVCKKSQADRIFYDLMMKVPEDRAYAKMYYIGVVIFGIVPWYLDRR